MSSRIRETAADAARTQMHVSYARALYATAMLTARRSQTGFDHAPADQWTFSPYVATPTEWARETPRILTLPINAAVGAGVAVEPSTRLSPLRRSLDLLIAAVALLVFAPVLLLISLKIKLSDGGPALFNQERIGRGGRRFRCWKFRSMVPDAEARLMAVLRANPELREEWDLTHKLKDDPRITRFGAFLRKTSLDELPQLFNILAGDMSIVGPRPIVEAEIEKYGRWFRYYTAVTPGLTGLWQVAGRSDLSYRRRVAMDRLYIRLNSLQSYLTIVLATVPAVLARRGAC